MRAGGRILIIFGIVLGLIAFGAIFLILRNTQQAGESAGPGSILEGVDVVVALQPIEPYQEIPPDALEIRTYPVAPESAVRAQEQNPALERDPNAAPTISGIEFVAGQISSTRIYPGQLIVKDQLVDKTLAETQRGVGGNLSYILADNEVGIAVPMDQISSVAGAVQPGDYVDFLATVSVLPPPGAEAEGTPPQYVTYLLQRVQVVRVGPWSVQEEGSDQQQGAIVTVIVEPQQAAEIRWIQNNTTWQFVLRSITDEADHQIEPVNQDYMLQQYNIPTN